MRLIIVVVFAIISAILMGADFETYPFHIEEPAMSREGGIIRWMEFEVPLEGLQRAKAHDIATKGAVNWIDLLAYTVAKNWGKYPRDGRSDMDAAAQRIASGESVESLADGLRLFSFYREAYGAVLGGLLGEYEREGENGWEIQYGLKAFFPLARGHGYTHFDDFGEGRSYGYRRRHLGHDLMAAVGTPVVAVEDGHVEALGWNRYGGWRIGIRSTDRKRYYYYAHLRKGQPFAQGLSEGDFVRAGDVIGYVGMTGYSNIEDTNNITTPHLHLGLQIIFDEAQKDGPNQIWVDLYSITKFLSSNKMPTSKPTDSPDHVRKFHTNSIVTD